MHEMGDEVPLLFAADLIEDPRRVEIARGERRRREHTAVAPRGAAKDENTVRTIPEQYLLPIFIKQATPAPHFDLPFQAPTCIEQLFGFLPLREQQVAAKWLLGDRHAALRFGRIFLLQGVIQQVMKITIRLPTPKRLESAQNFVPILGRNPKLEVHGDFLNQKNTRPIGRLDCPSVSRV